MNKLIAAVATVSALGFATAAFAQEPVQLTAQQMDTVTAGAATTGLVTLSALALGGSTAATETEGFTVAFQVPAYHHLLSLGVVVAAGSSSSAN
jgi:hypothetical protein